MKEYIIPIGVGTIRANFSFSIIMRTRRRDVEKTLTWKPSEEIDKITE